MNPDIITEQITKKLIGAEVNIHSPDNVHFYAEVIYSGFKGKSLLEQHRMVYATIDDLLKSEAVHALKLDTKIPGAHNE